MIIVIMIIIINKIIMIVRIKGEGAAAVTEAAEGRRVNLSPDDCLEIRACFASLKPFIPRVIKFCVASTSAVSEPRTAASATTRFARSFNSAAFGTHGTGDTRRVRCEHWSNK